MAHTTGTTSPDLTSVLTTWLNKNFVKDLEFVLQHQKCTTKAIVPKGAGNIGRFLTFAAPTKTASYSGLGTTALTEATTTEHEITGIGQTSTNITIAEFGEWTKVGQLYEYAAVSGTREKLLKRLRDGASYSIDSFVRSKALLTTTVAWASTGQFGATTTAPAVAPVAMNCAAIIFARKTLFDNLASGFEGEPGIPNGHYTAVITPKQELDIVTEITTGRISWSNAVVNVPGTLGQEKFVNGYIGSIYQVAVLVTNNYSTLLWTSASDIGIVYAEGGVGAMAFSDMDPQIIINDVNSPYKNVNSFAWHVLFGAGLIDTNRVMKIYSLS